MNSADLVVLAELTTRTLDVIERLHVIARLQENDPNLLHDIERLAAEVGALACVVQQHEAVSWGRPERPPRQPPLRHIHQHVDLPSSPVKAVGVTYCPPMPAAGSILRPYMQTRRTAQGRRP